MRRSRRDKKDVAIEVAPPKKARKGKVIDEGVEEELLEMPEQQQDLEQELAEVEAKISKTKALIAKAKRARKGSKFNDEEKGKEEAEPSVKAPRKKPRPREKGSFLGMARDYEKVRKKKTKTVEGGEEQDGQDAEKKKNKKRRHTDSKWAVSCTVFSLSRMIC